MQSVKHPELLLKVKFMYVLYSHDSCTSLLDYLYSKIKFKMQVAQLGKVYPGFDIRYHI